MNINREDAEKLLNIIFKEFEFWVDLECVDEGLNSMFEYFLRSVDWYKEDNITISRGEDNDPS